MNPWVIIGITSGSIAVGIAIWRIIVALTGEATLTLTGVNPPTITNTSLPNYVVGQPYSAQLSASGGVAPYTFALKAGSTLPPGLSLSASGAITGTGTEAGTFTDVFTVTDSSK